MVNFNFITFYDSIHYLVYVVFYYVYVVLAFTKLKLLLFDISYCDILIIIIIIRRRTKLYFNNQKTSYHINVHCTNNLQICYIWLLREISEDTCICL